MREINEMRTIMVVVGYEACDGTEFTNKEECEEYEKMLNGQIIISNFAKLVVKMVEEDDGITKANTPDATDFVGSGVGSGYGLALVEIKNENDVSFCNAYKNLVNAKHGKPFTNDMIGKHIIVGVTYDYYGDNRENGDWKYETCWIYGTIEDQIALYAKRLREAFEIK